MSTLNRKHKRPSEESSSTTHFPDTPDLVTDHQFIAPYESCSLTFGLFSILFSRHILDASFSKLYQQSLKLGWEKLLTQERQKLKANDISVLKCFVLNRLLHEYEKDSGLFIEQTKRLYDEIGSRMTREFPQWTPKNLFTEVRQWQDIQCRRRLFYFHHQEFSLASGLLMLQKASTNWCYCLMKHCRENSTFWQSEGRRRFSEHFQHSFIIVAQPTGSDGAAVTQYTKTPSGHSARLNTRIICLLDPVVLQDHIQLSDIDVTLFPLNRETNDKKEKQPSIKWEIQRVLSDEGVLVPIFYAEVRHLQLETFDSVCKRLSLNSTLCQLELRWKIKTKHPDYEETIVLTTQPFGICSHAQYFPKFTAQIFLYEMKQILNDERQLTDPAIITEFVRRYHRRVIGIEPTDHTIRYVREVFVRAVEDVKCTRTTNSLDSVYEEILAKIISQLDFVVLHPVLAMMYEDGLFLGICNSTEVDQMLCGTRDRPQLLLRFNTLTNHLWNSNPTVQFIIHDGELRKASFDMKTFANELCRFICESLGEKTKQGSVLTTMAPRHFSDFQWYFHDELYRLNKMARPSADSYDPLLPVLWMAMRHNDQDGATTKSDPRRKRKRSDAFPVIDTVSSESPTMTSTNIVVHLDSILKGAPQSDPSTSSKQQQISIVLPTDVGISPGVIFRYLADKFRDNASEPTENSPPNYLIQPTETIISLATVIEANHSQHLSSPLDFSSKTLHSSSELARVESSILTDGIQDHIPRQMTIKEEPRDVDDSVVHDPVKYE